MFYSKKSKNTPLVHFFLVPKLTLGNEEGIYMVAWGIGVSL